MLDAPERALSACAVVSSLVRAKVVPLTAAARTGIVEIAMTAVRFMFDPPHTAVGPRSTMIDTRFNAELWAASRTYFLAVEHALLSGCARQKAAERSPMRSRA